MLHKFVLGMVIAAVACVAVVLAPAPASASFKVCNTYKENINSAVGYYSKQYDYFISEGWWRLKPGECKTALAGDLKVRYVYVYAVNNDASWEWAGDYKFCTDPDNAFTMYDAQNKCSGKWEKFREIDTKDYKTFTYTFE